MNAPGTQTPVFHSILQCAHLRRLIAECRAAGKAAELSVRRREEDAGLRRSRELEAVGRKVDLQRAAGTLLRAELKW